MIFQCNPVINIIATYALTETSSDQEKEQFYNDLNDSITSIPQHNFVVIAGDFNAPIGSNSHETSPSLIGSYMYHDQTNTNGQYLIDFYEEQNLISAFHRQPHKRNHMWTWEHPNVRSKAQIDHILIRKKWINSLSKCRAYSSVKIDLDHRIVTANI